MNKKMNKKNLDDMKIVQEYLPTYSYKPKMDDDIILDEDLSLYGVYGIPPKR